MIQLHVDMFISPGLFRVVRVLRVGRLLRFFEAAKGIRQLMFTIIKSAPALSNVGTLLFLIIFIYAIMGMSIFGRLRYQGSINQISNFETFGSSICLLFRVATAAGWNGVLDGAMHEHEPHCNPLLIFTNGITKGDCGNKIIAITFFVSYILLIVLIIINTYIAVILENFNDAQSQDEVGINEDDIEAFYDVWQVYDPKATQFIHYREISNFLDDLDHPFRIQKPNYWFLEAMVIPIKDNHEAHCLDIMHALIRHILGDEKCVESDHTRTVMDKVNAKYNTVFPQRFKKETLQTTNEIIRVETDAARIIQNAFRWYLFQEHMEIYLEKTNQTKLQIHCKGRQIESLLHALSEAKQKRLERIEEEIKIINEQEIEEERERNETNFELEYGDQIVETTSL